jgi:hypothetical protein
MKYLLLIIGFHSCEQTDASTGQEEQGPTMEEFMEFEQAMVDAGIRVDGSALDSIELATTVQVRPDGERVVTNGPFAETREYLGGYDIIDVPDLDAALDWAARCPGARYGRVEVRPLVEF